VPLGSAATTVISIDFTRAQGTNSSGRILFQPPRQTIGTTVLSPRQVSVSIVEGVGEITLVRLPVGTYHVTELIDNQPENPWNFALPLGAPSNINYEDIAAVEPVPEVFTTVRTVNGIAPDPVTGDVEVAGSGGSTPDATAVLKGKLQLAGDLGGTASAPTVPGLAGKAATVHTHTASQITDFAAAADARVTAGIAAWVGAAPAALDTLDELAQAIDDDVNFSTTIMTALGGKASAASVTAIDGRVTALENASAKIPFTIFDAAGDLIAGTANDAATKLTKGADGTFLGVSGGSLVWSTPAGGGGAASEANYPLSGYGLIAASMDPESATGAGAPGAGVAVWQRVRVPGGKPIVGAVMYATIAGNTPGGGIQGYSVFEDDGTLVGSTPTDNALFTSTGWRPKALSAPVASQTDPRFVWVAFVSNLGGAPTFSGMSTSAGPMNGGVGVANRRCFYATGITSWASINPVSTGSDSGQTNFIGLY